MQDSSKNTFKQFSIAFYNLENLFDTSNDPKTLDDDFTANSEKKWTKKRFTKKVKKLSRVISQIGYDDILHPPALVGVAEVENSDVLDALTNSKFLKKKGYQYVHFDSPDERGIDTGLLYREDFFTVHSSDVFGLHLTNEHGVRDYTRDILYVYGSLEEQPVHILVNHWPSRRQGMEETAYKRIAAAERNREIVQEILAEHPDAKIIIMGDFNDDPKCESIQTLIQQDFYNPMEMLHTKYEGSLSYKGKWNLFDQIIVSNNFMQQHDNPFRFESAEIFNPRDLTEYEGKYKGNPFRTFVGKKYLGGFSDHFPVYNTFSIGEID